MLALRMGPSIGAIAVGGGLTTLAVAAGMFGLFGVAGKFLDRRLFGKITDREILSHTCRAPVRADFGWLQQMGNDLSERFGVSPPVNVFLMGGTMRKAAVAFGESGGILSTVKENWALKEMEFIMAHEIAHIKAGDCDRASITTMSMIDKGTLGLAVAGLAQIFAQASFPVMVAGVGIGSAGLLVARRLVQNYERHSVERRRDVEALQKTGDLQSALSAMRKVTSPAEIANPPARVTCLFRTYPSYEERVLNLVEAYYRAVENGDIRPAVQLRASHSTHQAALDRPLLSPQID